MQPIANVCNRGTRALFATARLGWKGDIPFICHRRELNVSGPARGNCKVVQVFSEPEGRSYTAPARHIHPTTEADGCDGRCNLPIGISRSHERRD